MSKDAMSKHGAGETRLPVFLSPTLLEFYSEDSRSHRHIVTLYNPYDITLKYKVLTTSPDKYIVSETEGIVKPRCCVDILIRLVTAQSGRSAVSSKPDKFRVNIYSTSSSKSLLGSRDITATYAKSRPAPLPTQADFFNPSIRTESYGTTEARPRPFPIAPNESTLYRQPIGPSLVYVCAAVLCIVLLMFPAQKEGNGTCATKESSNTDEPASQKWLASLAFNLALTVNQKLILSYILGILTILIIRTG